MSDVQTRTQDARAMLADAQQKARLARAAGDEPMAAGWDRTAAMWRGKLEEDTAPPKARRR